MEHPEVEKSVSYIFSFLSWNTRRWNPSQLWIFTWIFWKVLILPNFGIQIGDKILPHTKDNHIFKRYAYENISKILLYIRVKDRNDHIKSYYPAHLSLLITVMKIWMDLYRPWLYNHSNIVKYNFIQDLHKAYWNGYVVDLQSCSIWYLV